MVATTNDALQDSAVDLSVVVHVLAAFVRATRLPFIFSIVDVTGMGLQVLQILHNLGRHVEVLCRPRSGIRHHSSGGFIHFHFLFLQFVVQCESFAVKLLVLLHLRQQAHVLCPVLVLEVAAEL